MPRLSPEIFMFYNIFYVIYTVFYWESAGNDVKKIHFWLTGRRVMPPGVSKAFR